MASRRGPSSQSPVFQLPPMMGSMPRFDPGPSSSGSLLMNAPLGCLQQPQGPHQQQQQLLPLMSFGPPFLMQPSAQPPAASVASNLAHLQQQQQREGNNHSGHTHAIQLQTSLEMAPVVCPALCEIRTQLQELTRSVESCQNEVRSSIPSFFSTKRNNKKSYQ